MIRIFADRREAGRVLGRRIAEEVAGEDVLVLGLPRGGVPVAFEVAAILDAPLDVLLVRKLGLPGHEELAMGAIASGGVRVLDDRVLRGAGVDAAAVEEVARREQAELERREAIYREGRPAPALARRTVVLVDDGLATGSTARAAVAAVRRLDAERVVVAVPVGAPDACIVLERDADAVVCVEAPDDFVAVGHWYENFSPTEDDEVRTLLRTAARGPRHS